MCCLCKYQKGRTWIKPCHLWLVSRWPAVWQQELDNKAMACFVYYSYYPNRITIRLLQTSKQKTSATSPEICGEVSKMEVKVHNNYLCLQDERPMWWRPGSKGPLPFPAYVDLHILVLDGLGGEKNLWENNQMSAVSFVWNLPVLKCTGFLYTDFFTRHFYFFCMQVTVLINLPNNPLWFCMRA